MTKIVGRPQVSGTPSLRLHITYDVPYQGAGRGASTLTYRAAWDYPTSRWLDENNVELQIPLPRQGQNDAALRGRLTALVTVGTIPRTTTTYNLAPYETAPGEVDLTIDPLPVPLLPSEALPILKAQLEAATGQYNAALAAFAVAIATLNQTTQGLAALNVRAAPSFTDGGLELAYGIEANERLAFYIDTSGKSYMPLAEIASALIKTLTVDNLTIRQTLTVAALQATSVKTTSLEVGASSMTNTPEGSGVVWGIADAQDRLAIWVDSAGTFHASQFGTEFGSGNTGGGGSPPNLTLSLLDLVGGDLESINNAQVVWGIGDSGDRLPIWLDPAGQIHLARPLGAPTWDLAAWGGNLMEALASKLLLAPGRPINLGWAEQTSGDVAARFGAMGKAATFTAAAATAGVYPLTLMNPDLSPLSGSVTRTLAGRLSGVRGVLTRTATGQADALTNRGAYYTFTPDAGAPIETGLVHAFSPDNPYRLETTLIGVGRADIGAVIGSSVNDQLRGLTIADNIQAIVQSLSGRHERYVVLGLLNAKTEVYGAGLERIMAYNAQIASVAGHRYFDVRAVFCRNADGTWRADGSPDPQYMADNLTLNALGLQRLADALKLFLIERGFYA